MGPGRVDIGVSARSSMLERLLAASARSVAPGGESGAWQWLLPALVVLVISAGAFAVSQSGGAADRASARATAAATFSDAVVRTQALATNAVAHPGNGRDALLLRNSMRSLSHTLVGLERVASADPQVQSLAPVAQIAAFTVDKVDGTPKSRTAAARQLSHLGALAAGANRDLASAEREASAEKRTRTPLTLGGGLLLALLLMWTFWAKRTRQALADSERRYAADRVELEDQIHWQAFHDALT